MRSIILSVILAVLFIGCTRTNIEETTVLQHAHYDINLKLEPENQFIKVEGSLQLPVHKDSLNELTLYLHKQLKIDTFYAKDCIIKTDTNKPDVVFLPDARQIKILPQKRFTGNDMISISYAYEGVIDTWNVWSANTIGEEWTEIGLYFPWFPFGLEYRPFTYHLEMDLDPKYKHFVFGKTQYEGDRIIVETQFPTNDMVVCVSKNLKLKKTALADKVFTLTYLSLSDTVVDSMVHDINTIMEYYNAWFGPLQSDIFLVESARSKGGGYGRIGGVYLSGFEQTPYLKNRKGYHRYLGHEFAHLYWYKAPTSSWEDWLNEAFAEYSAMMIMRAIFGDGEYTKRMAKKKETIMHTNPIWNVDRNNDEHAHEILYNKGPIILSELEKKMGKENFLQFCQACISGSIDNTQDFLDMLSGFDPPGIHEWMENELKNR